MHWRTHIAIGGNAIWLTVFSKNPDQSLLVFLPVAILASLLPDIDAAGNGAKIHYIGGGVLGNFKGIFTGRYFHHRGIMHSVFVSVIFFIILFLINLLFLNNSYPLLPYVFFLSYFSHPIIDGFNTSVGYLYPFSFRRMSMVPYVMRSPVKGFTDNLLFIFGIFGILLFFLLYAYSFASTTF
jgi:membrane-bound metal-dependent hydrolase YbcI (DUF457 family)